jgi:hypothetical protein
MFLFFSHLTFLALAGWGPGVFTEYNYWFVVPMFACHLGAVAGAWAYYLAIEINWPDDVADEEKIGQQEKIVDRKTGKGGNYLQVIYIYFKLMICALNFSMPTCTSQPRHTNPLRTQDTPTPGPTPQMRRSTSHYQSMLRYRMAPVNRGGQNRI